MNQMRFIEAISCIESDIIEKHLTAKIMLKRNKALKNRLRGLKYATIAACFVFVLLVTPIFANILCSMDGGTHLAAVREHGGLALLLSGILSASTGFAIWKIGSHSIRKKMECFYRLQ